MTTKPRPESARPVERRERRSTVLLADDHAMLREGLEKLLTEHGFDVVGTVATGDELLDAARRSRPDVIVTDISMPGLSGLDVLARLKAERADSKVIVLTMHSDAELATRAARAGASGFLLKHSAGEELVTAVHQALQGRVYFAAEVTKGVMERLAAPSSPPEPMLTPRQLDVLRLILEGRRMKEIAAALDLSTRTVETHKYQMMDALCVSSTAELVKYAIEHRLITE
jgi:two-component system response regulator NreC